MTDVIRIDGSHGEGGGQVLRTALAVSAALGRPFVLDHVRANRKPPGLKAQHLAGVRACAALTEATLEGAAIKSNRLAFSPTKKPAAGTHRFEIGTAGATGLLIHAMSFPLWLAGASSDVVVTGGTHVEHAPGFDYLDLAWAPALAAAGFVARLEMVRAGFYPKGGGEVHARLEPAQPRAIEWKPGRPVRARVAATASGLPEHVAERLAARASERLLARWEGLEIDKLLRTPRSPGPGCAVTAVVELEGGGRIAAQALGEKGKPAERVADEAVDALLADLHAGASVDEHLADQLLLPMALGAGGSFVAPRASDHLTTNAATLRLVLPEANVQVSPVGDGPAVLIRVQGAGLPR